MTYTTHFQLSPEIILSLRFLNLSTRSY